MIFPGKLGDMYSISSGKPHFQQLLAEFLRCESVLAHRDKIRVVGVLTDIQNGCLDFSFDRECSDQEPQKLPNEMEFALVTSFGLVSPMKEWHDVTFNGRQPILDEKGAVLDWSSRGSYGLASPIFDAVCGWLDEFFVSCAELNIEWIVVDEMGAAIERSWKPGKLAESKRYCVEDGDSGGH